MYTKKLAPVFMALTVGYILGSFIGLPKQNPFQKSNEQEQHMALKRRESPQRPAHIDTTVKGVFEHFGSMPGAIKVSDHEIYHEVNPPRSAKKITTNSSFVAQFTFNNLNGKTLLNEHSGKRKKLKDLGAQLNHLLVGMGEGEHRRFLYSEAITEDKNQVFVADVTIVSVDK